MPRRTRRITACGVCDGHGAGYGQDNACTYCGGTATVVDDAERQEP